MRYTINLIPFELVARQLESCIKSDLYRKQMSSHFKSNKHFGKFTFEPLRNQNTLIIRRQKLISTIRLIGFMYLIMSLKETDISTYQQVSILHHDTGQLEPLLPTRALKTKKEREAASSLGTIYITRVVCLNIQRYFSVIVGLSLKVI